MELTTVGIRHYYGPIREYYVTIMSNCGRRIGFEVKERNFIIYLSILGVILEKFYRISHILSNYTTLFKMPGIKVLYGIFQQ